MENHDIKQHSNCLKQLCGLCLGRVLTKKDKKHKRSAILCSSKAADIQLLFGMNVTHDIPGVHPESMCLKCVCKINYYKQKKSDAALNSASEMVEKNKDVWAAYNQNVSPNDCTICSLFDASTKLSKKKAHVQSDISLNSTSICSEDHVSTAEISFENVTNDGNSSISTDTPHTPILSSTPLKDRDNDNAASVAVDAVKTTAEILKSSLSEPLDAEEEAVLAQLIRRKLHKSNNDFF